MIKGGTALGSHACASFVEALGRRGITLSIAEGGMLAAEPRHLLTPGDLSRLADYRREILARLRRNRVLL